MCSDKHESVCSTAEQSAFRKCSKCEHYSYSLRRCKLGKINPSKGTLQGVISAENVCGRGYVCRWSKWRPKLDAHYAKQLT